MKTYILRDPNPVQPQSARCFRSDGSALRTDLAILEVGSGNLLSFFFHLALVTSLHYRGQLA